MLSLGPRGVFLGKINHKPQCLNIELNTNGFNVRHFPWRPTSGDKFKHFKQTLDRDIIMHEYTL